MEMRVATLASLAKANDCWVRTLKVAMGASVPARPVRFLEAFESWTRPLLSSSGSSKPEWPALCWALAYSRPPWLPRFISWP